MEILIAILLAAILGPLGLSGKVERGIEGKLRQDLGHVGRVDAQIHRHRWPFSRTVDLVEITLVDFDARSMPAGGGLRIGGGGDLVGKVNVVAIHCRNFRVNDLPVERLDVWIRDIRYDLVRAAWRRDLQILRVGKSDAEAALRADAITKLVAPAVKQVDNIAVRFGSNEIIVTGDANIGVHVPVRLTCGLAAAGDGRINLVNPQAHVSVVPVPGFIVSRMMRGINPLVDLNKGQQGPFEFAIDRIRISPRHLIVHANLIPRKQR